MQNKITGRVWVLTDAMGELIDNIDTDMIFHNRYLAITEQSEMGKYALDNLKGWEDFASKAQPGNIVVVGANFGCGSSRQGAVDCFSALGISAIVAASYGAIYFRNAVNVGFPVLEYTKLDAGQLASGDMVAIDLQAGEWSKTDGLNLSKLPGLKPLGDVQREIMEAGGLFNLAVK